MKIRLLNREVRLSRKKQHNEIVLLYFFTAQLFQRLIGKEHEHTVDKLFFHLSLLLFTEG